MNLFRPFKAKSAMGIMDHMILYNGDFETGDKNMRSRRQRSDLEIYDKWLIVVKKVVSFVTKVVVS